MTGAACLAYIEQVLVSTLALGGGGVLDNFPAHKPVAIREAIVAASANMHFLPAYSPDFSRIVLAFPKIKARPGKVAERTVHRQ